MTNLEVLKARVSYPLSNNSLEYALAKRSLDKDDIWISGSDTQSFDLAYADALCMIMTTPNSVMEGGYSVTQNDRKFIMETANAIYKKYGEASLIPEFKPKATFVQKW